MLGRIGPTNFLFGDFAAGIGSAGGAFNGEHFAGFYFGKNFVGDGKVACFEGGARFCHTVTTNIIAFTGESGFKFGDGLLGFFQS